MLFGIFKREHDQEGMMTDDDDIYVFGLHGSEFRVSQVAHGMGFCFQVLVLGWHYSHAPWSK